MRNRLGRGLPGTMRSLPAYANEDGCSFVYARSMGVALFVRYERRFSMDFCSREHTVCPLSGIKKRPLVGGFLNTSTIVISIGDTAGVLCREVVRRWEGPLSEVPLYF